MLARARRGRALMAIRGNILVTGAGGFVGRHVLERGTAVLAAAGDLRDRETAMAVVAESRPAGVIHLAAATEGGDWQRLADDVAMTGHLIEALAEHAPDAPLLVPGSAAQYGMATTQPLTEASPLAPVSAYGARKCALEVAATAGALQRGVRVIWARGFNHLGPGQAPDAPVANWARQVALVERAGGGQVHTGRLDRVRDFLDVRDVADAYLALLGSPGSGPVNVCSGQATRLEEIADLLRGRATAPVEFVRDPLLERGTDPVHVVGDPAQLYSLVSWRPRYALEESVGDALDEWRDRVTHGAVGGAAG
jgi:GDP-4-dehydro-6-deoxy-D-mannose reductase